MELSIKLYQNLINQIKDTIESEIGIMDENGLILLCSNEEKVGQVNPLIDEIMKTDDTFSVIGGQSFQKIYIKNKLEYIVFINSDDSNNSKYLRLISINIVNIKAYYDEKYDKINFIKSVILDNILPGDITLRAKELHITSNVYRVAFLIKTEPTKDIYAHEIIEGLFPRKAKDFVVILDDETTVLIKELNSNYDYKEVNKNAKIILDNLSTEGMIKSKIGIGTVVDNIKDIGRSFKEAQTAILIGEIFESEKNIIDYNKLGIGRLIYQLPPTLCRLFLNEVFKDGAFEALDTETMNTIVKFFENNLNVSETSRQLFVHRNTLVYRLDKIQKITGLDLRLFDDAIIFKVAILVKKYLDSNRELV